MKRIFSWVALAFFLGISLVCAADFDVDLGMKPHEVTLSKESANLIAGEKIKVSTSVFNYGNSDATGAVLFFIGPQQIGQSSISLRPGGVYDKFFVDMVVPQNDFNILIRLVNVQPEDQNTVNNEILSSMFHVQQDIDNDGIGDELDPDDDNDGLTDDYEIQFGTNPNKWDTDGDGVNDKDDAYPLDMKKWKKDEPVVPKKPIANNQTNNQIPNLNNQTTTNNQIPIIPKPDASRRFGASNNQTINLTTVNKNAELVEAFYKSPEVEQLKSVTIKPRQVNWNTFFFGFTTNIQNLDTDKLEYSWNYDGAGETKDGYHTFKGLGKHNVNLRVRGPWDNYIYDNIDVNVTFWSLYNYWLWLIALAILGGLFYGGSRFTRKEVAPRISRELKKPKVSEED